MELGRPEDQLIPPCHMGLEAYLWIPGHTGSMVLLDVFLQSIKELREGLCPSDSSWITACQLTSEIYLTNVRFLELLGNSISPVLSRILHLPNIRSRSRFLTISLIPVSVFERTYDLYPSPRANSLADNTQTCSPFPTFLGPVQGIFRFHYFCDCCSLRT